MTLIDKHNFEMYIMSSQKRLHHVQGFTAMCDKLPTQLIPGTPLAAPAIHELIMRAMATCKDHRALFAMEFPGQGTVEIILRDVFYDPLDRMFYVTGILPGEGASPVKLAVDAYRRRAVVVE